jgi:hypothetical protein
VRREKRRVESLPQAGEAGRDASGSTVLPYGESLWGQEHDGEAAALLNLKQCCEDVRVFEIRILASSIEKQLVLDAFMQI